MKMRKRMLRAMGRVARQPAATVQEEVAGAAVEALVGSVQVWSLSHFFRVFCEKKSLICLEGKSISPSLEKYFSLPFPLATPLSPLTFEGLFELTRCPSRALILPCALPPELQRNKDTIRYAALGAEVQGHRHKQLTKFLMECFLHRSLIVKSEQNRIELVTRPVGGWRFDHLTLFLHGPLGLLLGVRGQRCRRTGRVHFRQKLGQVRIRVRYFKNC